MYNYIRIILNGIQGHSPPPPHHHRAWLTFLHGKKNKIFFSVWGERGGEEVTGGRGREEVYMEEGAGRKRVVKKEKEKERERKGGNLVGRVRER